MKMKLTEREMEDERMISEFEEMQRIMKENGYNLHNLCKTIISYKKTIRSMGRCIIRLSEELERNGASDQA
ncbi:MAG: hypothetical protein MNSN_01720 [Minisyncoccus archaeiphilus]|nr:MAG: hypothetical protein MNSN_01720 [Candidatus Parcubacteria bacterium]